MSEQSQLLHRLGGCGGAEADDHPAAGYFDGGSQAAALGALHTGIPNAEAMQGFLDALGGAVGVVAVVAQMAEHHVMQARVGHAFDELCRLVIGKVAVTGADALLGGPRAFGVSLQQLGIVIGFHKKAVGGLEAVLDQVGDKTDVAEHPQAGFFIGNDKADGIHGIVRNRETFNAQILEIEGAAGGHHPPRGGTAEFQATLERFAGERCGIEG